jgi:hypothetical protein
MLDTIEDLARELRIISDQLDGMRFAGLDQNPKGIRDLLASSAALANRLAKKESK